MAPPPGIEAGFPLARLTTIGTGGAARFLRPARRDGARAVLAWATPKGSPLAVIGLGSNLLVADDGFDGLVLRLDGALAAIEIDGHARPLRRRRVAGRPRAAGHRGRLVGHRVRLRHPGHRRRRGAHERRRLRPRAQRRAARGDGRLGRGTRRGGPPSSSSATATRTSRRGGGGAAVLALEPASPADPRQRARDAAPRSASRARRAPSARSSRIRPGAGRRRADRGLRAQGPRHRRRAHLAGARELHRERRGRVGRRRGAGEPARRACASARLELEHEVELLGWYGWTGTTPSPPKRVGGGAADAPKRGACSNLC